MPTKIPRSIITSKAADKHLVHIRLQHDDILSGMVRQHERIATEGLMRTQKELENKQVMDKKQQEDSKMKMEQANKEREYQLKLKAFSQ